LLANDFVPLAHVVQDDPDNPEMPGTFNPVTVVFEPELTLVIFLRSRLYEWLWGGPVAGRFLSSPGCLGFCQENELLLLFDMLLLIEETWLTCDVVCLWDLMRSTLYRSKTESKYDCTKIIPFVIQFGFCEHSD